MTIAEINPKGQIVITLDLYSAIEHMTREQRERLVDTLACQDEVIDEVMNQVLEHCTTLGSHGSTMCGAAVEPITALDRARRRVAMLADKVAAQEIVRLKRAAELLQKDLERERDRTRAMF